MGVDRRADEARRTGFSLCSIADWPLGSHQSAANLPKWAASSGRMVCALKVVALLMPPP
jgi:hypothetical protein